MSPEGRNILRGISRRYIMEELAPQVGMPVVEKNIEPYDVYTAEEVFMTGAPFCMLPVTSLNGVPIGDGKVGKGFNTLLGKWSEHVGVDIQEQIRAWNEADGRESADAPTPYRFKK